MKKVTIKRALGIGVVTGLLYAAYRAYRARAATSPQHNEGSWEAAPFPFPPIPRPAPVASAPAAPAPTPPAPTPPAPAPEPEPPVVPDFLERSIEPDDRGNCPGSHPIKGKLTSGIYHEPGGLNYTRTRADRCYLDAAAAESDGLRAAKR